MDYAKVNAVERLPSPSDLKIILSFLEHMRFCIIFIKGFSQITIPLSNLLRLNHLILMKGECTRAFSVYKKTLTSEPTL